MARDTTRRAEHALLALLDDAFEYQQGSSPRVLASVRAWQGLDRTYELVQRMARRAGPHDLTPAQARIASAMWMHLDAAIASGSTPLALVVYRGVRDLRRTFGAGDPRTVVGHRIRLRGYTATTVSESVAVEEFSGSRGALLEVVVPAGTPALWVAAIGDPTLRRQGELLLKDGIHLHAYSLGSRHSVPILSGRVSIDG
jgi:hypothetical protein